MVEVVHAATNPKSDEYENDGVHNNDQGQPEDSTARTTITAPEHAPTHSNSFQGFAASQEVRTGIPVCELFVLDSFCVWNTPCSWGSR